MWIPLIVLGLAGLGALAQWWDEPVERLGEAPATTASDIAKRLRAELEDSPDELGVVPTHGLLLSFSRAERGRQVLIAEPYDKMPPHAAFVFAGQVAMALGASPTSPPTRLSGGKLVWMWAAPRTFRRVPDVIPTVPR